MTDPSAWKIIDWMVRECAPGWLDHAGLRSSASAIRALSIINSPTRANAALATLVTARDAAKARWETYTRRGPAADASAAATRPVMNAAATGMQWAAATGTWKTYGVEAVRLAMYAAWYAAGAAGATGGRQQDSDAEDRERADGVLKPTRDTLLAQATAMRGASGMG